MNWLTHELVVQWLSVWWRHCNRQCIAASNALQLPCLLKRWWSPWILAQLLVSHQNLADCLFKLMTGFASNTVSHLQVPPDKLKHLPSCQAEHLLLPNVKLQEVEDSNIMGGNLLLDSQGSQWRTVCASLTHLWPTRTKNHPLQVCPVLLFKFVRVDPLNLLVREAFTLQSFVLCVNLKKVGTCSVSNFLQPRTRHGTIT